MKTAIRVDASNEIGTGHVMRCLTLALELRQKEAQVVFVCRKHPGYLYELIKSHGFEVRRLCVGNEPELVTESQPHPAHLPWLGTGQDTDAEQTIEALQEAVPLDWLIIDHYALGQRWEMALRQVADRIMVIDDIADRKHECDLLLDQNYFQDPGGRYDGLVSEYCETLLGPRYAMLRSEFSEVRNFCHMRGNGVARVLVYFGGNDPDNLTGMALEALRSLELEHLFVEAVIGPNNQNKEQIKKQVRDRPGTRLHIQSKGFAELLLRADLCIGAGGTTTWERLCLRLPSLVVTVAENQESFTTELDQEGFVTWIGRKENVSILDIKESLVRKIDKLQSEEIFFILPNPVDGLGALRVAEKIIPSKKDELSLRQSCQKDVELYYFWANDPVVRENSFRKEPITWQGHVSWFKNRLESSQTGMWVMQTPYALPVGQIRFDIDQEVMNISYSLDPIARGRKWGAKLLELGINKISESAKVKMIQGKVKKNNPVSRRIFLKLGFNEAIENDVFIFRKRIL